MGAERYGKDWSSPLTALTDDLAKMEHPGEGMRGPDMRRSFRRLAFHQGVLHHLTAYFEHLSATSLQALFGVLISQFMFHNLPPEGQQGQQGGVKP